MAKTFFKLTTILSLLITLSLHTQMAFSSTNNNIDDDINDVDGDDDELEYYEVDTPLPHHFMSRTRSRFLATSIKKGTRCNPKYNNICNGVSANKGTQLLQCCKKKCVNVLGDMNNCGQCGKKCKLGERCCSGTCINILHNVNNCGKCNKKCKPGIPCRIGICGYA